MVKKIESLIINSLKIMPGEYRMIRLDMPKLQDWTALSMPVHIFRGQESGPTLCITSTIHGDEVNGIEITRRLLKKKILKTIKGTLIVIPVVNVYGFLHQSRYLMDRRDLNRSFPGQQKGSLASRLAHMLTKEIISKSTHLIDLHSGSLHRTNLPHIRADLKSEETEKLAKAFNVPVILNSSLRDGSLRQCAKELGIPALLYEAGEALRFDELSIKTGVNGIINVMRSLKMLPSKKNPDLAKTTITRNSYWIRAPHSGILRPSKTLGKTVKEGEVLAEIGNPTSTESYELLSPISGIIIGKNNHAMVHEGAALFHIATFKKLRKVAEHVEYLQESFINGTAKEEE